KTNDKWTPLWSSGISGLVSEEKFYNSTVIPYLKIRATYGYSGNIDPSKSAETTIFYYSTPSEYTNTLVSEIRNFYNPDLRWEKVRTGTIGLDFRMRNNRITGSIDYYAKEATDFYASVPVDYTVGLGYAAITMNSANMRGKGLDVELNSLNIDREFKWH